MIRIVNPLIAARPRNETRRNFFGNESVPEVVRVVIVATDQTSNLVLLRSYDRVLYLNKRTNESENVGGSFKLADA